MPLAAQRNVHRRVWVMSYDGAKGTTFKVCYSEHRKRRTARSFHDKATANKYRRDFERFLNGKGPHPEETERYDPLTHTNWDCAVKEFLACGDRKPRTIINIRSRLGKFQNSTGIISVEQVTDEMIERWLHESRTRKNKASTKATTGSDLRCLATFLRWARPSDCPVTKELIQRWRPYRKLKRARPHIYSEQEFENMLSVARALEPKRGKRDGLWWEAFLSVAYHTGFRLDEISHMIWADVDWENNALKVQPHHKLKGVIDWTPKGKARRVVPVPADTIRLLLALRERQTPGIPYVFLEMDRYVQVMRMDKPPATLLHMILAQFKDKIRNPANIMEGTIHDFRRTFATRLLRQGVSVHHVQVLCGHQQLNTTLDIYNEVSEEDAVSAARNVMGDSVHARQIDDQDDQ